MDCSEFIARFSDYYDRSMGQDVAGPMEAHLNGCASCRRYHRVVREGGQMLRSLPRPDLPADFRPRLQHRIYHVDDEAVLPRSSGSGTTGATAFAMAVLLTLAAWTPTIKDAPTSVTLSPDLAETFEDPVTSSEPSPERLFQPASVLTEGPPEVKGLWNQTHSHSLLYEYSLLSTDRTRQRIRLRQTGLE
jgi:hypothetical protein